MSDPQRLLEREGLCAALLRAGCEERPPSESLRRTLLAIGVSSAVASAAGEAAGGGAGVILSGVAGSTAAKVGASSITLAFAAKWVVIGGLGGLVTVGAGTQLAAPHASAARENPAGVAVSSSPPTPVLPQPQGLRERATRSPFAHEEEDTDIVRPLGEAAVQGGQSASARAQLDAESSQGGAELRAPTPTVSAAEPPPALELPSARTEAEKAIAVGDRTGHPSTNDGVHASPLPPRPRFPTREPVAQPTRSSIDANPPSADDGMAPAQGGSGELSLRLNNQVALIDGAWAAMKRNDPAGALRVLSDYERAFPVLDLHPEVLFLRMTAQEALGQRLGARADAGRIVALYPRSAQARRAREVLALDQKK